MNRRKFLNVGGISLLGLNGMWSAVSSRFNHIGGSVTESFMSGLGAAVYLDSDDDILQKLDCDALNRFLGLGYQFKKESIYSKGKFLFLGLELSHEQEVCDEVVLTYYQKENWNVTGTINARQMTWFIHQYSTLESLALSQNCAIIDIIIPKTTKRFADQGLAYYKTREGVVGFKIELIQNDVKIHGVLKNKDHQTQIEETLHSTFYPNIHTLQTLV